MSARICVVTAGHLSTSPRMLKAADALHAAGYHVRVVSANHTPWATAADRLVSSSRRWEWTVVDYARETARAVQMATGARFRAAQALSAGVGAARVPLPIAIRAYSRAHDELVGAVVAQPADYVYGGTTGALAAVAESAAQLGVPYGIDLEDFHSGEQNGANSEQTHALAERIERQVLDGARLLTTSSPMIAGAYARKYQVQPVTIHNTFSMAPAPASSSAAAGPLRLYWFSQTLGAGRGLEDVIHACGLAGIPTELHMRARPSAPYLEAVQALQRDVAPSLTLVHHEPAAPDEMVRLAQGYDAGLSCEESAVLNRGLSLCNKIFTYLAAGVPVILSRTPAQAALAQDLGPAALVYDGGDASGLADRLQRLASDAGLRRHAGAAARAAAERRWHWEHPADRGALLEEIASVAPIP